MKILLRDSTVLACNFSDLKKNKKNRTSMAKTAHLPLYGTSKREK